MLEIKELQKKDYKKAIQFCITGMHFDMYMDNRFFLNLYGKYFLDLGLSKATDVIAAYEGDELMGLLMVEMDIPEKPYATRKRKLLVNIFNWIQTTFVKGVNTYDDANKEMKSKYLENNNPNGEIILLAANPCAKGKGIGTFLLKELEQRYNNKEVYLFTDNGCTYQFYAHRGFEKVGSRKTMLEIGGKNVPLECMLFRKRLI